MMTARKMKSNVLSVGLASLLLRQLDQVEADLQNALTGGGNDLKLADAIVGAAGELVRAALHDCVYLAGDGAATLTVLGLCTANPAFLSAMHIQKVFSDHGYGQMQDIKDGDGWIIEIVIHPDTVVVRHTIYRQDDKKKRRKFKFKMSIDFVVHRQPVELIDVSGKINSIQFTEDMPRDERDQLMRVLFARFANIEQHEDTSVHCE